MRVKGLRFSEIIWSLQTHSAFTKGTECHMRPLTAFVSGLWHLCKQNSFLIPIKSNLIFFKCGRATINCCMFFSLNFRFTVPYQFNCLYYKLLHQNHLRMDNRFACISLFLKKYTNCLQINKTNHNPCYSITIGAGSLRR